MSFHFAVKVFLTLTVTPFNGNKMIYSQAAMLLKSLKLIICSAAQEMLRFNAKKVHIWVRSLFGHYNAQTY